MAGVLPDFPEVPAIIPRDITTRFVNSESGEVTAPDDPDGYEEYYLAGTEPAVTPAQAAAGGNAPTRPAGVTEELF